MVGAFLASFPSSVLASQNVACETAVVGGGWAGVYSAWRLVVDSKMVLPADLCLFEARAAVGGRTYSHVVGEGDNALTLDIGAYRFGKEQHLPGDLILRRLNLLVACYEPDCRTDADFNTTLYKIVDSKGRNAGYATPIRAMLKELEEAGARIYYGHELTGVYSASARSALHFAGGDVATAAAVLLNLPRPAIERLDPQSSLFPPDTHHLGYQLLRNCTPCFVPTADSHIPPDFVDAKVYAIYEDPWWLSKLNLSEGTFNSRDDPPLAGRYHDGPVIKSVTGVPVGPGALEVVYTYSLLRPEVSYYLPFAKSLAEDPLTVTTDTALLKPLHDHLMSFHAAAFAKVGIDPKNVPIMSSIVLGTWTTNKLALLPSPASSNLHEQCKTPACPSEPCLHGVTPLQYEAVVSWPNPSTKIHIANNDFTWTGFEGVPCCWAEQTLKSAERTLHNFWALSKPAWLNSTYYAQVIASRE